MIWLWLLCGLYLACGLFLLILFATSDWGVGGWKGALYLIFVVPAFFIWQIIEEGIGGGFRKWRSK